MLLGHCKKARTKFLNKDRRFPTFHTATFLWGLLVVIVALITVFMIWITQLVGSQPPTVTSINVPPVRNIQTNNPLPTPVIEPASASWTMTAVGDIMLDRHVRDTLKQKGQLFPFALIKDQFINKDLVLANLEGPFTNSGSVATNEKLIFTFDPAMAPILRQVGFTTFSLANNHTFNFGQAGVANTRQVLQQAGLEAFGDPKNTAGFSLIKEIHDQKIGLIGYHGLVPGLASILQEIRDLKPRVDTLIVMPHWGVEYSLAATTRQRSEAHQLIEAGADIIIGAHPHVVEPVEIYQGKFIAYSLGNFLFDQYFSQDTLEGLLLHITVADHAPTIQFVPVVTKQQQIQLLDGSRKDMMLQRLAQDSLVSDQQKLEIGQGQLVITADN